MAFPWGAFSISKGSQVRLLVNLLEKNKVLESGIIHKPNASIPVTERKQMTSIIDYLCDIHGVSSFDFLPLPTMVSK